MVNLKKLLSDLLPKDILNLYISNVEIEKLLDTREAINFLNVKFDINIRTKSFTEWYKAYTRRDINPNILYLYDLEKYRYINQVIINNILKGKNDVTENMIYILYDWLYAVRKKFKMTSIVISYTYTLFFILISKINIPLLKKDLQLYGCVCLRYASLVLEEYSPESFDYVFISDKAFNVEEFENALVEVFDIFSGNIIYPSPIFFIDTTIGKSDDNDNIILLTTLSSMIVPISIYKPSLIAKTCIYMITGKIEIYSFYEINIVCNTIQQYLNKFIRFKLEQIKPRAETIKINYLCSPNSGNLILEDLFYVEQWHLGDVETGEFLGKGGYGEVVKIKRKTCGKEYAVKTTTNEDLIPNALLEIVILNLLKNENNIINICGYKYDKTNVAIILSLMDGSLLSLLKNDSLNFDKYDRYFNQILEGVYQCHRHDIIHRDLKLENLVYDNENDSIKIIDFGASVPYQSFRKITDTSVANTYHYRPPECLLKQGYKYGQEIDIWAIGCVMYYMMTKKYIIGADSFFNDNEALNDIFTLLGTPTSLSWPGFDQIPKSKKIIIKNHPRQLNELEKILAPYSSLILDCLIINPNTRPSAENLLNIYFA